MSEEEKQIHSYENQVKKGYSELGHEGLGVEHWGTMIAPDGVRFNGYTDKRFIKHCFVNPILRFVEGKNNQMIVTDLGGDEGFLLEEIFTQIRAEKPDLDLKGIVVDIDSTGKAREKFKEKQEVNERQGMQYVVANITKLPFVDQSIDVLVSRMALQYLDKVEQERFLHESSRVLKPDGLLLLQTVTEQTNSKDYNEIWMEITRLLSKEVNFKRLFPAFGSIGHQFSGEKYGLETLGVSRRNIFPFSARAFAERFNVYAHDLERLYKEKSKQFPDQFEEIDGQKCFMGRLLNAHFRKTS